MQMSLSRLFLADTKLHFRKNGSMKPTRWLSSSSSSKKTAKLVQSKKAEAHKEQKAAAVESVVKKYMQIHPGIFPKVKHVQDEVGGSWYLLKDILMELKEKLLPIVQIHDQITTAKPQVTSAFDAIVTEENLDSAKLNDPGSRVQLSEVITDSEAIEATEELDDTGSRVQLSQVITDSEAIEATEELDGTKLIIGDQPLELHSSTLVGHDGYQKKVSNRLSCLTSQIECKEGATKSSGISLDSYVGKFSKVTSGGNGDKPPGVTSWSAPDQSSLATGMPISTTRKVPSLADMFTAGKSRLIGRKNETLTSEGSSDSKADWASDFNRNELKVLLGRIKKLAKESRQTRSLERVAPNNSHDTNQLSKDQGHGNERCIMHESLKLLDPNEKKKTTGEGGIYKTISKVELNEKEVKSTEPYISNLIMKDGPNNSRDTNQLSKDQGHGNERSIMHESLKLLDPNEEKKTTGEGGIHKTISKVELNEKEAKSKEPYISNLIMKDGEGKRAEFNGRILCNKNKELVEDPIDIFASQVERKDESGSDSDFAAFDYQRLESSSQIQLSGKRSNHSLLHYTEKGKYRNDLILKFLVKSAKVKDISLAFSDCGPIAEIRILPSRKDDKFNYAYIVFKTEKGLRKALSKTDAVVHGSDVIVESISTLQKMPDRTLSLDNVGELDIPMGLLRNPSRTVMIQGLPHDLASHHLRHALSFCGHISGFTMGSSSSVAYVEFETEDTKEKALMASSISISGKLLPISRIDSPVTTVVRISNINPETGGSKIHAICSSYGQVKRAISRSTSIYDVHFKLSEWANMRNILNRLNGLSINEHQWIAQPATVIPPEILQILWTNPDGRHRVHSLLSNLCQKIEGSPIHTGQPASEWVKLLPSFFRYRKGRFRSVRGFEKFN